MRATTNLAIVAIALCAGCGATVHSSLSPTANVGQYRTFSFYRAPGSQGQPESLADQEIRRAINDSLAAKGIVELNAAPADFKVAYHVVLRRHVAMNDLGYGLGDFGPVDFTTYTEGTLVVDFIDPHTNKVFWRGTATQLVNDPNRVNTARLDKAVAKLINRYPYQVAARTRPTL